MMQWVRRTGSIEIFLLAAVGAVLIVPILWAVADTAVNQYRSMQFGAQLYAIPLPERTVLLKEEQRVGLLVGNGNHCDFIADLHVASALSQKEIEKYYSALRLKPVRERGDEPYVLVSAEGEGLYLIRAVDSPNTPGMDLRCH